MSGRVAMRSNSSESKYCSVAAMLRKTALISFRYEILPAKP